MDATTAGLIGALGGAALGAGGAWFAALIALKGSRYQADRQADSSHQQWLRQIRRETYARYLSKARGFFRLVIEASSEARRGGGEAIALVGQQLYEAALDLGWEAEAMKLEADASLIRPIDALSDSAFFYANRYVAGSFPEENDGPEIIRIRKELEDVAECARVCLQRPM
ncbi:hypothetical protein [Streptomyces olivaceus]|uniref:hypothetical protein n=1 Tax=Streptomyces olivaceus TaxID=47716 RepID=UPI00362CF594